MKYVLDVAKWKCGRTGRNALGDGLTGLLNPEGFSCCLGQFAQQMGVPEKYLKGCSYPSSVSRKDQAFLNYDESFIHEGFDTDLTECCTRINDDTLTTVREKIAMLEIVLNQNGHELEVINQQLTLE